MENSRGTGLMVVLAVSGSVVFVAMQIHKRAVSRFMKKIEYEIKNSTGAMKLEFVKKKVRFASDMAEVVVGSWPRKVRPSLPSGITIKI